MKHKCCIKIHSFSTAKHMMVVVVVVLVVLVLLVSGGGEVVVIIIVQSYAISLAEKSHIIWQP